MNLYQEIITEATGLKDADDIAAIEDTMRANVGTLDHLTRKELANEARIALLALTLVEG